MGIASLKRDLNGNLVNFPNAIRVDSVEVEPKTLLVSDLHSSASSFSLIDTKSGVFHAVIRSPATAARS